MDQNDTENFFDIKPDTNDSNIQLLKSMGFPDENEIRQALEISKNDLNEAISILTSEKLLVVPTTDVSKTSDLDMDLSEQSFDHTRFPFDCLLTLEQCVFSDSWSISYKKNEWLDRLLRSSIYLTQTWDFQGDDLFNYNRFVQRGLYECFKKLLNSIAVNKWNEEIIQGVYTMTSLCIELIQVKLTSTNKENLDVFLQILALIFTPDSIFNKKNSLRTSSDEIEKKFTNTDETLNGWLIDFINLFGNTGGFERLKTLSEITNDLNELNLLLKPVSVCAKFLNSNVIKIMFEDTFRRLIGLISSLESSDQFKDKNTAKVFELIETMKKLSSSLWPEDVSNFNQLHLQIVISMLKNSHFNSKMNSLKEISKLIENSKNTFYADEIINEENLSEWLVNERVLSLAIEGNIDQAQYCDKIKTIIEFIADRITQDEIESLWSMQFNKSITLVDNLYSLISIASTKFNQEQFDYLIDQIKSTWSDPKFKSHDKLLTLFRMIGQESKAYKTYSKILEALWELKDDSNQDLVQLIYKEHLNVISAGRLSRDQSKNLYLKKCLEQVVNQPGTSLTSIYALKHMLDILFTYKTKTWTNSKCLKDILSDIVVPEIKSICQSLLNYNLHQRFNQQILDVFKHEQIIDIHLNLIKFILKEGNLYLKLIRAQEIWDSLNESNDLFNKEKCFEWFMECLLDLNESTRMDMFKEKILKLSPSELTLKAYECYRLYFLYFNQSEAKIQITTSDATRFLVDDSDIDLSYLWEIILTNRSSQIIDLSIKLMLEMTCGSLSMSLRRDMYTLNLKLIQIVYEKLKENLNTNDSKIENLLKFLEEFIRMVNQKESQLTSVSLSSHFNSIKMDKFDLKVLFSENSNEIEIKNLYSNDLLIDLRSKISRIINNSISNFQLFYNDMKLLAQSNDHKTLGSLEIDGTNNLVCKIIPSTPVKSNEFFTSSCSATPTSTSSLFANRLTISSTNTDPKKYLPSVIISSNPESYDIFDKLLNHKNSIISSRVRDILNLIPTNPKLIDSFDSIVLYNKNIESLVDYFQLTQNSLVKIMYNLETLSVRLNTENFKQNFIKLNGIGILIDLLSSAIDFNDQLENEFDILLINLIDYLLFDDEKFEPDTKKSLFQNNKLIDSIFKIFIKKSMDTNFNNKISIKSINLIYNLISTNTDQILELLDTALFRLNILNVLISSKSILIRKNLADFFVRLSLLNDSIKFKLIHLVLKNTRLPIWINSTRFIRISARDLVLQSSEYFNLLSCLIEHLPPKILTLDQDLNSEKMLMDEINWLRMFNITQGSNLDEILLNGHFKLTKSILTNTSQSIKNLHGPQLIDLLIKSFLFQPFFNRDTHEILNDQTLSGGYEILIELVKHSPSNFKIIQNYLTEFNRENKINEWNFMPLIKLKSNKLKYVGLKNGGATCYMNSVLQQLFMIPGVCDYLQSNVEKSNDLMYELINVFMHLKKSNQEFYLPDKFWVKFRMWNSMESINVREQQDAFDFFISLTDQIDECLQKEIKREPVFKAIFEGMYSNQFICQDCEHSYDRQETFLALNLSVKTFSNLEQSMSQFVKDELLTGDNSYFCEKCNLKRSAIKRTCLKQLPKYLCIQLKRFDYDWESNRSLKFDDYFEFPQNLNVKPYTYDYLNKVNTQVNTEYELCGIIVHSGQANAGHYYSFIKEPFIENDSFDEEFNSKWFKFNDTQVDEIVLNEQFLIEECFGGNFTKSDDTLPEERTRYWNAYMLLYKNKTYDPKQVFKNTFKTNETKKELNQIRDSISELSDLVQICDNRVVDSKLDNEIRLENLNLLKQNLVLSQTYFEFMFKLIEDNLYSLPNECVDLTFNFLFMIYLRTSTKLKENTSLTKWSSLFESAKKSDVIEQVVFYLNKNREQAILKTFILDTPVESVRIFMVNLVNMCLKCVEFESFNVNLILNDLCDLVKSSILTINLNEILKILWNFGNLGDKQNEYLSRNETFIERCFSILTQSNPIQLKDFPILFELISSMILKSQCFKQTDCEFKKESLMMDLIEKYLFNPDSNVILIKQFVCAFEQINSNELKCTFDLIRSCCLNNKTFSFKILKTILQNINQSNLFQIDIKQVILLLQSIILIDDEFQLERLKACLEGFEDTVGLLAVIRANQSIDAKKSYNCVKIIVNLANQSEICKEYMLKTSNTWEWSVNWLKSKMSENFETNSLSSVLNSSNFGSSLKSNESSGTKSFQRTKSAQATLDCAMDLLSSNSFDV